MKLPLLIFYTIASASVSTDTKQKFIRNKNENILKMNTEGKDQARKMRKNELEDVPYYMDDDFEYYEFKEDDLKHNYDDDFSYYEFKDDYRKHNYDDDMIFPRTCSYDSECSSLYGDDGYDDSYIVDTDCATPACNDGICSIGFLSCTECPSSQGNMKDVEVSIKTDEHPMAAMYIIRNTETGEHVMWGGPYKEENFVYSSVGCISPGTYKFTMYDYWSDGFEGNYSITVAGKKIGSANNFSSFKNDLYFNVTECTYDENCSYGNHDDSCISPPTCNHGFCSIEYLNCEDCDFVEAKDVELYITTDSHPSEISWNIIDRDTDIEVMKGGSYTGQFERYSSTKCLTYGSYKFTIFDSYGDGLNEGGMYSLLVGGKKVGTSQDFYTDVQEIYFNINNQTFINECDKNSDCEDDDICTLSTCETGYCSKDYLPCSDCGLVENMEVLFITDYYPNEILWDIRDAVTEKEVMKGGYYTNQYQTYSALKCFDYGSYKFTVHDSGREGYFGKYYLLLSGMEIEQGYFYGQEKETYFNITRECFYDSDCDHADTCTTSSCINGRCLKKYLECSECDLAQDVEVTIQTDSFPSETSWAIIHVDTNKEIMAGGNYTTSFEIYNSVKCFESGNYKFTIFDAYGDGLTYGGGYSLSIDGKVTANGGDFAFYEEINFYVGSLEEEKGLAQAEIGETCEKNRDCRSKKCERDTCCQKKGGICSVYSECCSNSCKSGLCE